MAQKGSACGGTDLCGFCGCCNFTVVKTDFYYLEGTIVIDEITGI